MSLPSAFLYSADRSRMSVEPYKSSSSLFVEVRAPPPARSISDDPETPARGGGTFWYLTNFLAETCFFSEGLRRTVLESPCTTSQSRLFFSTYSLGTILIKVPKPFKAEAGEGQVVALLGDADGVRKTPFGEPAPSTTLGATPERMRHHP